MSSRGERARAARFSTRGVSRARCASVVASAVAVLCVLVSAGQARAAGFAVQEQGADALGVGNAVTARAGHSAAHLMNPAGTLLYPTKERKTVVMGALGVGVLRPTIVHTSPDDEQTATESSLAPVPLGNVTVARHMGGAHIVSGGLYAAAPFGSSLKWPEGWSGRYAIESTSLRVLETGANVAWSPHRDVVIGLGARLQFASLDVQRGIDVVDPDRDARVSITTSDIAPGMQAGVLYRPLKKLRLGLAFRSPVRHQLKGRADFQDVPVELTPSAHDSDVSAELNTPARVALGAHYRIIPALDVSADVVWWGWGSFEQLVFDFEDEALDDVVQRRDWQNTVSFHLGLSYRLIQQLSFRAGFIFDPSPAPASTLSPSSPDSARLTSAFGMGYIPHRFLRLDLAVAMTALGESTVEDPEGFQGSFAGQITSVSLNARFLYF